MKDPELPRPAVRALVLLVLALGLLAIPYWFLGQMFGDRTYIQTLSFPGGSVEINSGDGDPIFGFTADVRLKDGQVLEGNLGYSSARLRHKLVLSDRSPVIGVVEKDRSDRVVMLIHPSTGEFWALEVRGKESWRVSGAGEKLLDQLRVATGRNLYLASEDNR